MYLIYASPILITEAAGIFITSFTNLFFDAGFSPVFGVAGGFN
jgi:hypothetical protein